MGVGRGGRGSQGREQSGRGIARAHPRTELIRCCKLDRTRSTTTVRCLGEHESARKMRRRISRDISSSNAVHPCTIGMVVYTHTTLPTRLRVSRSTTTFGSIFEIPLAFAAAMAQDTNVPSTLADRVERSVSIVGSIF